MIINQHLIWIYIFFWQISSKVSNTAPDLINYQKPQSSHSSSRVGVTLVAGVATVALGAFVFHRVWSNSWQRKEDLNRWHGVHAWQRFTTSYFAESPIVKCVIASAHEPPGTLKSRCGGSCFSCNDTVTLGKRALQHLCLQSALSPVLSFLGPPLLVRPFRLPKNLASPLPVDVRHLACVAGAWK